MHGSSLACVGAVGVGLAPTLCPAQSSATWFADFEVSPDASSIDVRLRVTMDTDESFLGFAASTFDTLNMSGSEYGSIIGWEILNDLDNGIGDSTTTDGESLFGTLVAHGIFDITDANPLEVLVFTWQAEDGFVIEVDRDDVSYSTSTDWVTIWVEDVVGKPTAILVDDVIEVGFGWGVVPAPGAAGVLGAGLGVVAWRRRRRG
jgi:hypothetical protein